MLGRWRNWAPFIIVVGYLSTLLLHADLGTYSRFIADDFCSAGITQRFGVLRSVWYWYLNWTGRYSASALDAVFGLLGPRVTPFVPVVVLMVWLAVLTYTAIAFSDRFAQQNRVSSFILALSLLSVTLVVSPNVPQSLYWGQGMRSIVPPLILGAVYADLLLAFTAKRRAGSRYALWLVFDFLLALFTGGLNETFTALELSGLSFALILAVWKARSEAGRRAVHFLVAGVLGAGLAMLLVMSAPGNAFRQAFYPPPPGLAGMLNISGAGFLAFLGRSIGTPERWTALIGAVAVAAYMGLRAPLTGPKSWLAPVVLAIGCGFAFLAFLPAAYGLSDAPPERTLMIPAHLLVATVLLASFIAGARIAVSAERHRWRTGLEAGVLLLAASSSLFAVAVSDQRLLASRASYAAYANHWEYSNAQILRARAVGADQILIQPMDNWAGLNEPNDNPKYWVNVCYRQYYGIEVLAASQP